MTDAKEIRRLVQKEFMEGNHKYLHRAKRVVADRLGISETTLEGIYYSKKQVKYTQEEVEQKLQEQAKEIIGELKKVMTLVDKTNLWAIEKESYDKFWERYGGKEK